MCKLFFGFNFPLSEYRPEEAVGQVPEMIGVKEELLEGAGVAHDVLRHVVQRTVPLVHVLNLTPQHKERFSTQKRVHGL